MTERNIKLTIKELRGHFVDQHDFVISVGDSGVEIRYAADPIATRDRSVPLAVGCEPFTDLELHVEECP